MEMGLCLPLKSTLPIVTGMTQGISLNSLFSVFSLDVSVRSQFPLVCVFALLELMIVNTGY